MNKTQLDSLRLELSIKAKNGVDFITAASIIWLIIAFIWTLSFRSYDKSVLTFIVGAFMLPLAFLFSKIYKTTWKLTDNPLDPLGLILNLAQLFYFPFLVLVLLKMPDYFALTYVIITGAHFFPYAWYYNEKAYAFMAGFISATALILGLFLSPEQQFIVPLFMSGSLIVLAIWIYASYKKKKKRIS